MIFYNVSIACRGPKVSALKYLTGSPASEEDERGWTSVRDRHGFDPIWSSDTAVAHHHSPTSVVPPRSEHLTSSPRNGDSVSTVRECGCGGPRARRLPRVAFDPIMLSPLQLSLRQCPEREVTSIIQCEERAVQALLHTVQQTAHKQNG